MGIYVRSNKKKQLTALNVFYLLNENCFIKKLQILKILFKKNFRYNMKKKFLPENLFRICNMAYNFINSNLIKNFV